MDAALVEACMVDGMSIREAPWVVGLRRDTVRRMLEYSDPPVTAGASHREDPRSVRTPVSWTVSSRTTPTFRGSSDTPPRASTADGGTSTTTMAATVPARGSGQTQRL